MERRVGERRVRLRGDKEKERGARERAEHASTHIGTRTRGCARAESRDARMDLLLPAWSTACVQGYMRDDIARVWLWLLLLFRWLATLPSFLHSPTYLPPWHNRFRTACKFFPILSYSSQRISLLFSFSFLFFSFSCGPPSEPPPHPIALVPSRFSLTLRYIIFACSFEIRCAE